VRALLEQYVAGVYRFALRLTGDRHQAEDLAQETLLRAWRHRKRLRQRKAARVWLFKIAANLWRDQVRRRGRGPREAASPVDECPSVETSPDRPISDQEDLRRALETMDSLPPRQREVLYLHACEGLSLAEIADVLGIRAEAAKASLSLARKRMRCKLADICRDRFRSE
jgi:RNA polymerase sigma-70 factor (ECF subfamily)